MMHPELTDEEIGNLIFEFGKEIMSEREDLRKDKFKVIAKVLVTIVFAAGGVAMSVLFPNPITIGVLGGAVALITGNEGFLRKFKKIKEKSGERKKKKMEMRNMMVEKRDRKVAKDIRSRINFIENRVLEPSAPKLYPDLSKT